MATKVDIDIARINLSANFALTGVAAGIALIAVGFALLAAGYPVLAVLYLFLAAVVGLISTCGFLSASRELRTLKPDSK